MADKKGESYERDQSIKPVLDTLNALLAEVRKQAQTATAITIIPPLEEPAEKAVRAFQEIREALDVTTGKSFRPGPSGS
jgi:hypothetical protein